MAAQIARLRTKADRLRSDTAAQLRQLVLEYPGLPERARGEIIGTIDRQTASEAGWTFVMPPWCTDQRGGRTDPSSRPGSRDADGLRAAELQHPVQGLDRDGDLGCLTAVRARPQRVPDHPLVAADAASAKARRL